MKIRNPRSSIRCSQEQNLVEAVVLAVVVVRNAVEAVHTEVVVAHIVAVVVEQLPLVVLHSCLHKC